MTTFTDVLPASTTHMNRAMTWTPGDRPGTGSLTVTDTRTHVTYAVHELPVGRGFTGRAVRLTKADGERYAVRCGSADHDHSCDCAGHTYGRGKPCKHVEALRALLANGCDPSRPGSAGSHFLHRGPQHRRLTPQVTVVLRDHRRSGMPKQLGDDRVRDAAS
jgi:hypothetical protein